MKGWQKFAGTGFLVGILNGLAMPVIITTSTVFIGIALSRGPIQYAVPLFYLFYTPIVFTTIIVGAIIGMRFERFATYDGKKRYSFIYFVIGFLLPSIIFLHMSIGIIQTPFIYLGYIIGNGWKEK